MQNNDYALVLGINDYPSYRSLRGAVPDAEAMAEWLRDETIGGALPPDNIKTILSSPRPPTPLQDQIDDALAAILGAARRGGGRRFYFYFSGHGCTTDTTNDVALCLAKWSATFRHAALSSAAYRDVMVRSGTFTEIVFFLDCCRVWAVRAAGMSPIIEQATPVAEASGARVYVAFATEFQSRAFEMGGSAADGSTGESRGIFTDVLLSGLRGAAADASGAVTASSLKAYLEAATPRLAKIRGLSQRAEVMNGLAASPDPVFGSAKQAARMVLRFRSERAGSVVLYGPHREVIREGPAESGPWELDVPRGLFMVVDAATGQKEFIDYARDKEVTDVLF